MLSVRGALINLLRVVINLLLDWRQIFVHLRKDILVRFGLDLFNWNGGLHRIWHEINLRAEGLEFDIVVGLHLFGSVPMAGEALLHIVSSLTKCFVSPRKDFIGSALDVETMLVAEL